MIDRLTQNPLVDGLILATGFGGFLLSQEVPGPGALVNIVGLGGVAGALLWIIIGRDKVAAAQVTELRSDIRSLTTALLDVSKQQVQSTVKMCEAVEQLRRESNELNQALHASPCLLAKDERYREYLRQMGSARTGD